ncbi:MAG: hypothetical protein Q7S60_05400 [bacterium]|nr:hypothetical protein [bacterium]
MAEEVNQDQVGMGRETPGGLPEIKDSAEFIWVLQNQYGATSADRHNPVIKTFGLGGCLALILYDPEARMAVLAHISPSVLMTQKMQERAASQRRESSGFDHLMSQINKLFYSLEDNGSHNAKYNERERLGAWMICSYGQLTEAILQRMKWTNVQLAQDRIFTQRDMDKIAFDTRNGQLYRLTPPIKGDARMSDFDILAAQLGELRPTSDQRSLVSST